MVTNNHTGPYTSRGAEASADAEPPRLTPAARRILDVASTLFYERGIGAVGVDTVAAEAAVTKKTIYDRFGSKDNLIGSYLAERDRRYRRWLTEWWDGHPDVDPLVAVFDGLGAWMDRHNPRGCAFVNAYAEIADPGHPVHRIAREQKGWLRARLVEHARRAGYPHPEQLAAELLTLHEGAAVLYSAAGDRDAALTARRAALGLTVGRTPTPDP